MKHKKIIAPKRLRRVPKQFSWVDHRLVNLGYLQRSSCEALALYLFLLTVADADGISYYADSTICQHLSYDRSTLRDSRKELINLSLVAFERPFYQVLDLGHIPNKKVALVLKKAGSGGQENHQISDGNTSKLYAPEKRTTNPQSIAEILNKIGAGQ